MLVVAFEVPESMRQRIRRGPVVVVLIFEKENLDRMRQADPFDMLLSAYGHGISLQRPLSDLDFVIAYEEDSNAIMGFQRANDLAGLLTWLERGRKVEKGDLLPPTPLRKN